MACRFFRSLLSLLDIHQNIHGNVILLILRGNSERISQSALGWQLMQLSRETSLRALWGSDLSPFTVKLRAIDF